MKVFFRRIHLYLSLLAGLVITVTCFTGAVLVFEHELEEMFHHNRYYVAPNGQRLPLEQIAAQVKQQVPGSRVARIQLFADPSRSALVTLEENKSKGDKEKKEGKKKEGGSKQAYVNPYTGDIIEFYSYQQTFFYTMFALHRWLLGGAVGKMIVGVCTLIFLFIIITGIILWWPKTRNILQQRLRLKWDGGWKRLNHDLHIVLGFYTSIFLFIFSFTGLAWSFEWFNKGIYKVTGSSMKQPEPPVSAVPGSHTTITFDQALEIVRQQAPDARFYTLNMPKDSAGAFTVTLLPANAVHESASTTFHLDQYSGAVLKSQTFQQRNLGQRVRTTFKPVHIGSVFGMTSKVIAFIVCLLGVTFPVTGVIMWINRTRKKTKRSSKSNTAALAA